MPKPDPDFGAMTYNGTDAWDCRIAFEFPHGKTRYFFVHLWAPASGPTEVQRLRFRELKRRYETLWPEIASRIAAVHDRLKTLEQVSAATNDWVAVHLGEQAEDSVELVIDLESPAEGSRAYFIPLIGWRVGEVVIAE